MPMKKNIDNCWNTIGIWSREHTCLKLKEVIHCHNCDVFHQATSFVYDAPLSEEYRDECTLLLREQKPTGKVKESSVLTFEILDEWLAIPVSYIKEITDFRNVQRLPHNKNAFILGIVNISGEIEISFSLEKILGLSGNEGQRHKLRHVIIAEHDNNHYVFPVSQLGEVYRYHQDDMQGVPSTLNERAGSFMHGIIKWKRRKVGVIDAELLFATIGRSL